MFSILFPLWNNLNHNKCQLSLNVFKQKQHPQYPLNCVKLLIIALAGRSTKVPRRAARQITESPFARDTSTPTLQKLCNYNNGGVFWIFTFQI